MTLTKYSTGAELNTEISDDEGPLDLTSASLKEIVLRKPDGSILTDDVEFVNSGDDGLVKYVIRDGVLDTLGLWKYQYHVTLGLSEIYTEIAYFFVFRYIGE